MFVPTAPVKIRGILKCVLAGMNWSSSHVITTSLPAAKTFANGLLIVLQLATVPVYAVQDDLVPRTTGDSDITFEQ